jgi:hypothetical protein
VVNAIHKTRDKWELSNNYITILHLEYLSRHTHATCNIFSLCNVRTKLSCDLKKQRSDNAVRIIYLFVWFRHLKYYIHVVSIHRFTQAV